MSRPSKRSRGGATVVDVARRAGVSPMTVSRVVNGERKAQDATREAVLKAVRELNYFPNPAARNLAGAEAARIGLLYSNPSAAYLSAFLVGTLDGCRQAGCQLVLEACEADTEEAQLRAVRTLIAGEVGGVILPPPLSESATVLVELARAGLPAVCVAVGRPKPGSLSVRINDFAAAYAMAEALLAEGHKEFGFILGHPNQSASDERWRGFAAALTDHGLDPGKVAVEQGYFTYRSGLVAAERLLSRKPAPTAIFASNDDMAAAAVNVAHRRGLHVPDQLSVAGFDDTSIATSVWPELTTVRQPIGAMAEASLAVLLAELRGQRAADGAGSDQVLEHALVARGSTRAPPVSVVKQAGRA